MLPAMFAGDQFTQRFTEGLDGTLAPVLVLLDCLAAYFDPDLAPPDFLEWLASWVGLTMDAHWPEDRRRVLVRETVDLYRWQGTRHGLATQVLLHTGVEATITEPGGVAWSDQPGTALPGTGGDEIVVSLDLPGHTPSDAARLRALCASVVPAHLRCRVQVGGPAPPSPGRGSDRTGPQSPSASSGGAGQATPGGGPGPAGDALTTPARTAPASRPADATTPDGGREAPEPAPRPRPSSRPGTGAGSAGRGASRSSGGPGTRNSGGSGSHGPSRSQPRPPSSRPRHAAGGQPDAGRPATPDAPGTEPEPPPT